jgi:zona occludens toxin (predicted ATPase)
MTAARQLAETKERIMSDEKSGLTVDTRPETHWPDCWRDQAHHNCAVALIDWQWGVIGKLLRAKATERDAEAAAGEQHYCGSCGA